MAKMTRICLLLVSFLALTVVADEQGKGAGQNTSTKDDVDEILNEINKAMGHQHDQTDKEDDNSHTENSSEIKENDDSGSTKIKNIDEIKNKFVENIYSKLQNKLNNARCESFICILYI